MPRGVYDRKASAKAMAHLKRFAFKGGHKDSPETRLKKSLARRGSLNPMFGRARTEEEKLKMSLALRNKSSHRGERNGNWRGGISKLTHIIRTHPHYQRWRIAIFERDNYTCQSCGKRGGDLNADRYPKTFAQLIKEHSIQSLEDAI